MAAHSAEHSHPGLYLWAAGHYAAPGHGGKMDHPSFSCHFRLLDVEGTFAAEAVKGDETAKSVTRLWLAFQFYKNAFEIRKALFYGLFNSFRCPGNG
jgi:hypothetical protein